MTKDEKIEIGTIVAGVVLILWLLWRNAALEPGIGGGSGAGLPNYLNYNQPTNNPNPDTLPTIGGTPGSGGNGQPSCSCGSGGTTFYADTTQFEEALNTSMTDFLNVYESNLLSQFPDYVSQFFNNQTGILQQSYTNQALSAF